MVVDWKGHGKHAAGAARWPGICAATGLGLQESAQMLAGVRHGILKRCKSTDEAAVRAATQWIPVVLPPFKLPDGDLVESLYQANGRLCEGTPEVLVTFLMQSLRESLAPEVFERVMSNCGLTGGVEC